MDADTRIIFDTPIEQRYDRALSLLGLLADASAAAFAFAMFVVSVGLGAILS